MKLSDEGYAFLVRHEGKRNQPYDDALDNCTVGIGHLLHEGPCTEAELLRTWTDAEVEALFRSDLARFEAAVNQYVTTPLAQKQYDALVSFTFNWGVGERFGFPSTSVLRLVNQRDFRTAAEELVIGQGPSGRPYDKGLSGVRRRREEEAAWLMEGVVGLPDAPPEEDALDACCRVCGSLWHPTADHPGAEGGVTGAAFDEPRNGWPKNYDPGEADRLIGRTPGL